MNLNVLIGAETLSEEAEDTTCYNFDATATADEVHADPGS